MRYIRHFVFVVFILLMSDSAWAFDFEVDGIYYKITNDTELYEVAVTYRDYEYNSYCGHVLVPELVTYAGRSYVVTSIGGFAFQGCRDLVSVTIPNSVTKIKVAAFRDCTSMAFIVIPNSITSLGIEAFYGCTGLTSISIPNSITTIDEGAFLGCTSLASIMIPNSVTSIEYRAFNGCTGLTSIIVDPENPVYDSRNNCNAIIETETNTLISGCKSTVIPSSVTSIGHYAFAGCTSMTSIIIPNSVTFINNYAFYNCNGLTSIIIPNSVTKLWYNIFEGCVSLASIIIPNSVTYISIGAFNGCIGLTSIIVDPENPVYDSRDNCNAIIETGTNKLICGCKSTIIPNSVTSIGESAFSDCMSLASIIIPKSVTSIGEFAFHGCTELISVTLKAETPPNMESNSFSFYGSTLHVLCGYRELFQDDENWGRFSFIVDDVSIYNVWAFSSDAQLGHVRIIDYPDCEIGAATVVAEPIGDHPFLNWTSDGHVVSTANPYTFVVEEDIELVANFYGTGIEEETDQKVTISPNPTKDFVNIECENMKVVAVCTLDGRVVKTYSELNTNAFTFDMSSLSRGIYTLRIVLWNGYIINKKIIKE